MSMWLTFGYLRDANILRDKEWDPEHKITAEFRSLELFGESGELCNIIKKLIREKLGLRGSRATQEDLENELSDVIICADLLALHYGIDLSQSVARKFNETSHKYGLRTFMSLADMRAKARL